MHLHPLVFYQLYYFLVPVNCQADLLGVDPRSSEQIETQLLADLIFSRANTAICLIEV